MTRTTRAGSFLSTGAALLLFLSTAAPAADEPARTLLRRAALVVTVDPALGTGPLGALENADVLLVGDRIEAVGRDLKDAKATVIDATGKILLPGFVDLHDHLWQSLIRGCGSDQELLGWLDECVFPMGNDVIGEAEARAGVRLSLLDLIGTGVTTVVDDSHAFTPAFVRGNLRALEDSGIRFEYAYCSFDPEVPQATVTEIRRLKKERFDPNPRARLQLCSHPSPPFAKSLATMTKLARELDVTLNVHLLESAKQRAEMPMKLLERARALGPWLLVNHAVHLGGADLKALKSARVRLAHNPLSNMRLGSGVAALDQWRRAGLTVGLGLDGGTNDTADAFANMKAAVGLQRAVKRRADSYPTIPDVLRMATMGGAEALGRERDLGSLTPGKKADLVLLNPARANFAPRWDWIAQIVLNGQPTNVEAVWIDGRLVKKDGVVLGVSREETVAAAERAVETIRRRLRDRVVTKR